MKYGRNEMKKCSFLGAGNMASAIIGGLKGHTVCIFDVNPSQYEKFNGAHRIASDAADAVTWGDYIFLCVKPQNFTELLSSLRDSGCDLTAKTFVSIAAGISTSAICRLLGQNVPVIRTMPNTPLLIGHGVTALSRNEWVTDADFDEVRALFASCGKTLVLPEDQMNAVIAATSTAPAYVYLLISAIANEAANEGLNGRDITDAIAAMVAGSAQMVMQSPLTPEELIAMVKSPRGTTEQALNVLQQEDFVGAIARAMQACTRRANELSL